MLEILKFIFSKWYIFLGTLLLIIVIGDSFVVNICNTFIKCINGRRAIDYYTEKEKQNNKEK